MTTTSNTVFSEGLQDVIAAESSICAIDGKNSKLAYRGYDIHDLAQNANFEETTYLLYFGKFPTKSELADFNKSVSSQRELPAEMIDVLEKFPKNVAPMASLRTAVSMLSLYDPEADDKSVEANSRKAHRLLARIPTIVAYLDRFRKGLPIVHPKPDASYSTAANFLYMLNGRDATPVEIKMLDKYFIILTEHDLNASTFAGRITASTLSDIYSAVTSAVGTLKGELHGFANSRAMESIVEIGEVTNVDAYVERMLAAKKKFMGFGHRMYKGPDPRAADLKVMAKMLADSNPQQAKWFAISEKLEKVVWEKKKLYCNVDFYSASVLYTIGIPIDMFTCMFAISRVAGWTAHILEQYANNRLMRPVSLYTGKLGQTYVPIEQRS